MANIKALNKDYVRFYIESSIFGKDLMDNEPGGWNDDNLELDRALNHGIFNKFSNSLSFYKKYKDLIENTFNIGGNNVSLFLIKEELLNIDGVTKFVEVYRGRADWETKRILDNVLSIKFNSNELEDLLIANEDDELELDRLDTIDDEAIEPLEYNSTTILGRELTANNHSKASGPGYFFATRLYPITEIIIRGFDRHSSVDQSSSNEIEASTMFIVASTGIENLVSLEMEFTFDLEYYWRNRFSFGGNQTGYLPNGQFDIDIIKVKRQNEQYNIIEETNIYSDNSEDFRNEGSVNDKIYLNMQYNHSTDLNWDEGMLLRFSFYNKKSTDLLLSDPNFGVLLYNNIDIKFTAKTFKGPSIDLKSLFIHDAFARLTEIIANDKSLFYSKYFGRTELGYAQDGEGGLMGLINGYWIRDFNEESEKYKSIQLSFKNLRDSVNCMFNTGMGTQIINNKKVIRIEEVKYFYQNKKVINLGQANNVERKYDNKLYFSGLEFGQDKGGTYDNDTGLDEPNVENRYTTPDRKSSNKYRKISKIRSDETEMELLRRKPQVDFPEEDFGSDSHNWFLDLKRAAGNRFIQNSWFDKLQSIPEGINNPESYRAFFFTPLRMMFRHGWIIRSGLEPYVNKLIKFASSKLNSNLRTHFIGQENSYQENIPESIEVGVLDRPRMLPVTVSFEAKLSKDVLRKIYETTRVFYNGSYENIPNYYFMFEWINENGEKELGYLMNMKPENLGKFTMQKANQ